jgi:hypothetical protein
MAGTSPAMTATGGMTTTKAAKQKHFKRLA